MKSKKLLALLVTTAMIGSFLAGCGGNAESADDSGNSDSAIAETSSSGSSETTTEKVVNTGIRSIGENGGSQMDHQVDKIVMTATSTSINVGPFAPSSPGTVVKDHLYGNLFYIPDFGSSEEDLVPYIAKSFTKIDSKTYDIEIFDYIKDSQGNSITIDDVIWSINKSIEIGQFVDGGSGIASLDKIDDYHMTMKLNFDSPNTFSNLVGNDRLYIINQEWWENATDAEKQENPATTGPYTVKEFISGSGATIVANDNFWQTDEEYLKNLLPAYRNVKEITYTAITEASMRVIALENNEVDGANISATDLDTFFDYETMQPKDGWIVDIAPTTYAHYLFPNMDAENSVVGANLELRKAIFYALDSEQIMIASGYNEATAKKLTALASEAWAGYQDEWLNRDYWPYDPEKAVECLNNAGYKSGELTVRLLSSSSLYNDSVRSVIISQLGAIGINVENVTVEQALFSTYKNDPTIWDLMIDVKSTGTGHVVSYYDYNFNGANYQNGGVNFCKDEELYARLDAILQEPSDENIKSIEQYIEEQAIMYGLFSSAPPCWVYKSDIIEIGTSGVKQEPAAHVFSDNYKSAGN